MKDKEKAANQPQPDSTGAVSAKSGLAAGMTVVRFESNAEDPIELQQLHEE